MVLTEMARLSGAPSAATSRVSRNLRQLPKNDISSNLLKQTASVVGSPSQHTPSQDAAHGHLRRSRSFERECSIGDRDAHGTQAKTGAAVPGVASVTSNPSADRLTPFSENQRVESADISAAVKPEPAAVPSTQMSRVMGFGSLATRLAFGTVGELVRRQFDQIAEDHSKRAVLSDGNLDALASTLCRMRGAALKLGQMLSMADNNIVPPELTKALDRVRQHADCMPESQLHETMSTELGDEWRSQFLVFEDLPLAAASLGQVHRATCEVNSLEAEPLEVAVKVQYPGVADSIDSDIANVMRLVRWTNFAPPGLYIDEVMRVARKELKLECDYEHEAKMQSRYRELLVDAQSRNVLEAFTFHVPKVHSPLSTERVLTTEYFDGVALDHVALLDQGTRNDVGASLLWLTMTELFTWRFMQTDPNWGNFLYNDASGTIGLIDFGAARDFSVDFIDQYLRLVWGAAEDNRELILDSSIKLGFLTGDESQDMIDAHLSAAAVIGEPFACDGVYDFANSDLTERVTKHLHVFGRERLAPPPEDAYALHRKLSGAFMACIKLGAKVECRSLLKQEYESRWGYTQ